ncbi:LysR substrate-binding domain-containing protein [Lactiplantibacillus mudanjiangensis]|uniref:LysR family transcriptional regulator [Lactobacillus sp.] n=1 Tax=Lactiplantibacillus mudanjiangensis TaxID=1296538 RepID=A0A660E293_9LACO|nr:LysR substrate-binding domain-containing protein [Lactiplantibacillus mudanjiangensis]VDG17646.1 LysR family transcriptional regulator [Lactobacillus sp.] [Lactiplantibacillus mudanjiangensis]VDG23079.1 LysR family transcriptional regulator [Lactobacillus sp.] [Lactiplantibacillus mudanjiangensis]VDG29552.1 LysR family transcriptional regulator [Lactobacillus sp.] [Lactiplantibacillus mudanjiangensis]VDG32665.1 LysR family transcriptional regulator [Lactobacillus sp.] [Lactiplantibacillus mu
MNTKDLAYFQELTIQKNFSKVAEIFEVRQPTITTAIQRLEAEFGAQLVIRDRVHHSLTITPSGQQLAEHAIRILRDLSMAHQEIQNLVQNQISLGLPPIIENYYFPKIAAKLKAKRLLRNIITVEGGSVDLRKGLLAGNMDMALLGSIEPLSYANLMADEFDRHPFYIFVSKNHPLADRKRVFFNELRHDDFVLFENSFVHNQAFNKLTRRNHFRPDVVFRSNDTHIIMKLVAQNVGITYLTDIVDHQDNVVRLELMDEEQPEFITSIVYRTSHILTPAQLQLLTIMHATLKG